MFTSSSNTKPIRLPRLHFSSASAVPPCSSAQADFTQPKLINEYTLSNTSRTLVKSTIPFSSYSGITA